MKFFLDQCISINIARGLQHFVSPDRHEIVHIQEKFGPGIKDTVWIPELRADGGDWIIVSGDPRITSSPAEKRAWMESGLTAFFFQDLSRHGRWVQLLEVVRFWPEIEQKARAAHSMRGYICPFKAKELRQIYPETSKAPRKQR